MPWIVEEVSGRVFYHLSCNYFSPRTGQTCLPGRLGERRVAVLLGECGISTGRCDKLCATVTVMEHLDCLCGCDTSRWEGGGGRGRC